MTDRQPRPTRMTPQAAELDELTIDRIADRLAARLREELRVIALEFARHEAAGPQLTVAAVADRLGVARSTVYAHWRRA